VVRFENQVVVVTGAGGLDMQSLSGCGGRNGGMGSRLKGVLPKRGFVSKSHPSAIKSKGLPHPLPRASHFAKYSDKVVRDLTADESDLGNTP